MTDDAPNLDEYEVLTSDTKRWRPPPEIEDLALQVMKGIVPLKLRLTDQMIEQAYDRGHQLYKTGQYKEALSFFHLLSILNPKHPKYLMGIAACHHMRKEYEEAHHYYNMAAMFDEENPIPIYHMADCLIKMDDPLNALIALEVGLPRCDSSPRFATLKDRMKMMMQQLDGVLREKQSKGELTLPSMDEEEEEPAESAGEKEVAEIPQEEEVIVDEERFSEPVEEELEKEMTEDELALEEMTEDELFDLLADIIIQMGLIEEPPPVADQPPPKEGT
jgi:type III secretion system low calcium response chaperone LcrH/SycD